LQRTKPNNWQRSTKKVTEPSVKTARDLLAGAKLAGLPLSEARSLISHSLQRPKEWLISHDDEPLSPEQTATCDRLMHRRAQGEPFAYLVGKQEFYGREFQVSPAVLIPRAETELLIDAVLTKYPKNLALRVIDLGTGSGCIAITLALERPCWHVLAIDNSTAAIDIAQDNANRLGASNVTCKLSTWWQDIDAQRFNLIVSNPPYIKKNDSHLSQGDLRFEPKSALTDHSDGLSAYRAILQGLEPYAEHDCCLFMEHGYDQATSLAALVTAHGLQIVEQKKDLALQPRLMIAKIA
jgi:release factor glutamine methyltransferase